jgi:hypothetical protein
VLLLQSVMTILPLLRLPVNTIIPLLLLLLLPVCTTILLLLLLPVLLLIARQFFLPVLSCLPLLLAHVLLGYVCLCIIPLLITIPW